jgi:hypothetical protein
MADDAEYVTDEFIAKETNTSVSMWRKRRMCGSDGPPFVKIGKSVRYHLPTFREWLAAQTRTPSLSS